MKSKLKFVACLSLLISFFGLDWVLGQNENDAFRYSQSYYPTNARSMGVANAFGALGANTVSQAINPAGFGLYRGSEISFSPSIGIINSETEYLGNKQTSLKPNFTISNIGLVFNEIKTQGDKRKEKGWVGNTFAMGINRQAGYHRRHIAKGVNQSSSILEYFAQKATRRGIYPSEFPKSFEDLSTVEGLAFKSWLINPYKPSQDNNLDSNDYYTSTEAGKIPNSSQEQNFTARGGTHDFYLSYAGNYSNKLYLGGTVGLPIVDYEQKKVFNETNREIDSADLKDGIPNYKSVRFTETFETSGFGVYGGFGFIYRAFPFLRIGGSIYSPTFYTMDDAFQYSMKANVKDIDSNHNNYRNELETSEFTFDYNLVTPFRALGSIALILSNKGFISFDYEYKNFGNARINADDYSFSVENRTIKRIFKGRHQFRLGAEYKINVFTLRGGFAHFTSPYSNNNYVPKGFNASGNLYSFGLGINAGPFNYDFAYQLRKANQFMSPYQVSDKMNPEILESIQKHQVTITFNYSW